MIIDHQSGFAEAGNGYHRCDELLAATRLVESVTPDHGVFVPVELVGEMEIEMTDGVFHGSYLEPRADELFSSDLV